MRKTALYIDGSQGVYHLYGRELAYELRGNSAAQRAVLAAQYLDGYAIVLHSPTEKQVAALFRISVATLDAAKALTEDERTLVICGLAPLVSPARRLEHTIRAAGVDQSFQVLERVMDGNGANGNGASAR